MTALTPTLKSQPENLLIPEELVEALQLEVEAGQQAEERASQAEALLARDRKRFGEQHLSRAKLYLCLAGMQT